MAEEATAPAPRVVVVGAGISGLVCAAVLRAGYGADPLVVEARDRIGGRIVDGTLGGKFRIPLGAEFVHGDEANILAGLVANSHPRESWQPVDHYTWVWSADGGMRNMDDAIADDDDVRAVASAYATLETADPAGLSVAGRSLADAIGAMDGRRRAWAEALYGADYGAPSDEVGADGAAIEQAGYCHGESDTIRVIGGLSSAVSAAAAAAGSIRTSWPVSLVRQGAVVGPNGEEEAAAAVVVAAPLAALRSGSIRVENASEREALWSHGVVYPGMKVFVQLAAPLGPHAVDAVICVDQPFPLLWRWRADVPVLVAYHVGAGADRPGVTDEEIIATVMQQVRAVFAAPNATLVSALVSRWPLAAGGAFSVPPVGCADRRNEAYAPLGRIYFCGEHTSPVYNSAATGAVETAVAAAHRVAADLGLQPITEGIGLPLA